MMPSSVAAKSVDFRGGKYERKLGKQVWNIARYRELRELQAFYVLAIELEEL